MSDETTDKPLWPSIGYLVEDKPPEPTNEEILRQRRALEVQGALRAGAIGARKPIKFIPYVRNTPGSETYQTTRPNSENLPSQGRPAPTDGAGEFPDPEAPLPLPSRRG